MKIIFQKVNKYLQMIFNITKKIKLKYHKFNHYNNQKLLNKNHKIFIKNKSSQIKWCLKTKLTNKNLILLKQKLLEYF